MWILANNAFLSIVVPGKDEAPAGSGLLLVRSRRLQYIKNVFPEAVITSQSGRDYQFRTLLPAAEVGAAIGKLVSEISYPNFKGSIREDALHTACNQVWHVMARLQPVRPYGRYPLLQRAPARATSMAATSSGSDKASVPLVKQTPAEGHLLAVIATVRQCLANTANRIHHEESFDTTTGRVSVIGRPSDRGSNRIDLQLDGKRIGRNALDIKLRGQYVLDGSAKA